MFVFEYGPVDAQQPRFDISYLLFQYFYSQKGKKNLQPCRCVACVHMTVFSDFQVHPSLQRRGIGRKIVEKITRYLLEFKNCYMYMIIQVEHANQQYQTISQTCSYYSCNIAAQLTVSLQIQSNFLTILCVRPIINGSPNQLIIR